LHSLSQDRSIGPHDQTGYQPAAAAMIDDMSSKFVARTQRFRAGEKFFTQNNPGSFSYAV
jgi:hypothetical protein